MRFLEILQLILEGREDFIAQQMGPKLKQAYAQDTGEQLPDDKVLELVNQLKAADPEKGKNLQFIVRMYATNQFKLKEVDRLATNIANFLRFKAKLPVKDLGQIKTLDQFYSMVEPLQNAPQDVSVRQQEKQIKQDAIKLIDTPNFKVIVPKTEEASCLYGKGTKWCTSAAQNNKFDSYNSSGPLYIIFANFGGKQRKFQLHVEWGEIRNEKDEWPTKSEIANLSKIPEYTEFLNWLIKKYYGPYFSKEQPS